MTKVHAIRPAKGFTLIELLVVVAIMAILMAILLPALADAKVQSQRVACSSRVRQLSLAGIMYAQDNNNSFCGNYWYQPGGASNYGMQEYFSTVAGNGASTKIRDTVATCPQTTAATGSPTLDVMHHTYVINASATLNSSYNKKLGNIPAPGEMMYFADGRLGYYWHSGLTPNTWYYPERINKAQAAAAATSFIYPHNGAMAVSFVDGHAAVMRVAEVQKFYLTSDLESLTPFWSGTRERTSGSGY